MTPSASPEDIRVRHRRTALECSALIDMLLELYPATARPSLVATDREVGAWLGQQDLIGRLTQLREEAHTGTDGLPQLLGG